MKFWLLLGILAQLVGCIPLERVSIPNNVDTSKPPNVLIARRHRIDSGAQLFYGVLDDVRIAGLFPGERVEFYLEPGEHRIGVGCSGGFLIGEIIHHERVSIEASKMHVFAIGPSASGCSIEPSSLKELSETQLSPERLVPVGVLSKCGGVVSERATCFRKAHR